MSTKKKSKLKTKACKIALKAYSKLSKRLRSGRPTPKGSTKRFVKAGRRLDKACGSGVRP